MKLFKRKLCHRPYLRKPIPGKVPLPTPIHSSDAQCNSVSGDGAHQRFVVFKLLRWF